MFERAREVSSAGRYGLRSLTRVGDDGLDRLSDDRRDPREARYGVGPFKALSLYARVGNVREADRRVARVEALWNPACQASSLKFQTSSFKQTMSHPRARGVGGRDRANFARWRTCAVRHRSSICTMRAREPHRMRYARSRVRRGLDVGRQTSDSSDLARPVAIDTVREVAALQALRGRRPSEIRRRREVAGWLPAAASHSTFSQIAPKARRRNWEQGRPRRALSVGKTPSPDAQGPARFN